MLANKILYMSWKKEYFNANLKNSFYRTYLSGVLSKIISSSTFKDRQNTLNSTAKDFVIVYYRCYFTSSILHAMVEIVLVLLPRFLTNRVADPDLKFWAGSVSYILFSKI